MKPVNIYNLNISTEKLFIVGAGPSSETLPKFDAPVLAFNSAIEFTKPDYWLFGDGNFIKWYYPLFKEKQKYTIITNKWYANMVAKHKANSVYWFTYFMQMDEFLKTYTGDWKNKKAGFLPGGGSSVTIALSLATLWKVKKVVLVGVDFKTDNNRYYNKRIKRNPGPGFRRYDVVLKRGKRWFRIMMKEKFWKGLQIETTSQALHKQFPKVKLYDE